MSSSAITTQVAQLKIGSVQNQADSSGVYSAGVWSFKNSTALTSVTITDAGNVLVNQASSYLAVGPEASGAVRIGDASAGVAIVGARATAGNMALALRYTNGGSYLEGMRIDSSGNLQVGLTSGIRKVNVSNSDSGGLGVIYGDNPNAANSGVGVFTTNLGSGNGAQNNTNCWHFRGVTANVGIWYLYGNGTHSFTSDQRLKKNIEPARDGYVEDLCKLRVVKYHWNTNEDSEAKELGLIAQEVEQVFPGLVQEADVEFEGGLKPKVLKGSVLPFMLLKAIQEQQSMIESMKAEIEALKAK